MFRSIKLIDSVQAAEDQLRLTHSIELMNLETKLTNAFHKLTDAATKLSTTKIAELELSVKEIRALHDRTSFESTSSSQRIEELLQVI